MSNFGLFYAIGAAVLWGLVYTIDQKVLTNLSPAQFLFLSGIFYAILTAPWLYFRGSWRALFSISKGDLSLLILAVILATLANLAIFSAIKLTNASFASIFEISYPFFVIIFSLIIFGGRLNLWFLLGSLLIFLGSAIIIYFTK